MEQPFKMMSLDLRVKVQKLHSEDHFMERVETFAQRYARTLLRRFAHEGMFDVQLRTDAEREAIIRVFARAGCRTVKIENRCRLRVIVPKRWTEVQNACWLVSIQLSELPKAS